MSETDIYIQIEQFKKDIRVLQQSMVYLQEQIDELKDKEPIDFLNLGEIDAS